MSDKCTCCGCCYTVEECDFCKRQTELHNQQVRHEQGKKILNFEKAIKLLSVKYPGKTLDEIEQIILKESSKPAVVKKA